MQQANTAAVNAPLGVALSSAQPTDFWDRLLIGVIIAGVVAFVMATTLGDALDPVIAAASQGRWSDLFLKPSVLWVAFGSWLLLFRTALWLLYRPFPAATFEDAPSLTVIIPAYNEGPMVERTIDSVARATYPAGRLEIIAIDDGSKDDTWQYISRAASRYPGLVTAVQFPVNRGKRAGLAEGFRRARGDVVVTIDSDSVIEPSTLLAIAGPFRDRRVGAVAGKVSVYNRKEGLIPRMLHVRYILSFDFLRSVQSGYRTVYCCPGALSAYRTEAVRKALPKWENQTFLGARCTFGEDRAMTNDVLALGYDAVYQRSAVVHTLAPTTYAKLSKMYLRWDRSYVREEIRLLGSIVWRRPLPALLATLLEKGFTNLRFPVAMSAIGLFWMHVVQDPLTLVRVLIAIGMVSTFYMLYYLRSERSWDFLYGVLYAYFAFFGLWWIFPYAVVTVRSRSWLTR